MTPRLPSSSSPPPRRRTALLLRLRSPSSPSPLSSPVVRRGRRAGPSSSSRRRRRRRRRPSSRTQNFLLLLLAVVAVGVSPRVALGFAYGPNFVTEMIASDAGREPVGLLLDASKTKDEVIDDEDAPSFGPASTAKAASSGGPIVTAVQLEPNGYLHLGHAKAVCFNFAVARMFPPDGVCHMRLDNTNPSKEGQEYVNSILEDMRWIQSGLPPFASSSDADDARDPADVGPWHGPVRKTSDVFDLLYDCAVSLIKTGDAYVDSDQMREYRGTLTEPGKESPYRDRSVEENLSMFEKMKDGDYEDGAHVLRAKIDTSSPNLNLRDPTLYRIKHEPHQATGDAWCLHPTSDFSRPIVDAIEGVTHSLGASEFDDRRRPLYDWILDKLGQTGLIGEARPRRIEFGRLNLKYMVLSKRKLIQLVSQNHVSGWDDPRMPTLSGVRRRGIPPAAVRLFCERIGISKSDSIIDYVVLEDCAREIMGESSSRAFAIERPLKITLTNWDDQSYLEEFVVPRHPKRPTMGDRTIPFGKRLFIDRSDFFDVDGPEGIANGGRPPHGFKQLLPNGGQVRLKFAYVIRCEDVVRDPETNEPIELKCVYHPETKSGVTPEGEKRVKGIIQWLERSTAKEIEVNRYDRLFQTEEPGKDSGDFVLDINPNSLAVVQGAMVEPSVLTDATEFLSELDRSDGGKERRYPSELSYQFERSGYFALDRSSTTDRLAFNRVATLRNTWGGSTNKGDAAKKGRGKERNRGGGDDDALALRRQAEALRSEISALEAALERSKAEQLEQERREVERVDAWIDQLLVSLTVDESTQILNTEDEVARLLQEGRFSAEGVNKIFDRICEKSVRRQSMENHSPLIALLLDAACQVDCLERDQNPNKRWNHRVERDLRKKLFAMGFGIDIDEVKRNDSIRAITGEKDYT